MAEAIAHYEQHGFRYIETAWAVPHAIVRVTAPNDECTFPFADGLTLVGSGEQSLLHLIEQGEISAPGKYQTTTPCFRNEVEDELHKKYFLKNELMIYAPTSPKTQLEELMAVCVSYHERVASGHNVNVVRSGKHGEWDITVNGIEVGSYGLRTYRNHTWIYGTGHAEPRVSIAMKMLENR